MIESLVIIAVLGVGWYFLRPKVADPFRTIVEVAAVILLCLWLLQGFGILHTSFPRWR